MASRGLTRQKANRNLLNVQYMKRIEDEMKDMMANFSQTFKERGAICDSEGFYQHTGQCWSDAIQMIFLWSDGLKEVVQHRLATSVIDDSFLSHIDDNNIVNSRNLRDINEKDLAKKLKTSATEYFKIVQHRFMRHYTTELERRKMYCSTNVPEARYFSRLLKISGLLHVQGKNAINSEFFSKIENRRTSTGGISEDISYVLYLYSLTFFDKKIEFHMSDTLSSSTYTNNAVYMSIFKEGSTSGHALCFYTCGGQDFLYDDNYGPIPFNWRKFCYYIRTLILVDYSFKVFFTTCKIKRGMVYFTDYYPVVKAEGVYTTYVDDEMIIIEGDSYSDNVVDIKIYDVMDELMTVYGIVNINSAPTENKGFQFERNARLNSDTLMFYKLRSIIDDNDIPSLKKLLVNPILDINAVDRDSTGQNTSLLIYAIKKNNLDAVNLILDHPKINVNHVIHNREISLGEDLTVIFNPLTAAFFYAKTNIEIVKRLLKEPLLNINKPISEDGSTILHVVIQLDNVDGMSERLAVLFLRNDLDVGVYTKLGATPLMYSYGLGRFDLIQTLCSKGATVNFSVKREDRQYFSNCNFKTAGSKPPLKTRKNRKN
jgi:ankyrin repeat protein